MDKEKDIISTADDDRRAAIAWLRDVLVTILDICPVPQWLKRKTAHFTRRVPGWLIAAWASALNVDYVDAYRAYPDFAQRVGNDTGREIARQYLETHNAVPLAYSLRQLVQRVIKLLQAGRLPASKEVVEREIYALALANCTPDGENFVERANSILSYSEHYNHPLIDYQITLESDKTEKLDELDGILAGGRYGRWVAERISEAKRWLGLEPPHFHIQYSERTPQWDLLWRNIFIGAKNE